MADFRCRKTSVAVRRGVPLAIALVLSACEESIEPLQPTEMAYSIHGYLDALADTQWIRVTPFRTSILSTPDPVDATVVLEDLASGRMIELVPTLFRQGSPNFGDTLFAYNFRTSEQIDHSATYRLVARRSDGSVTSSVVAIPQDHSHLPSIIGLAQPRVRFLSNYVRFHMLPGTHLAMVLTRAYSSSDPTCRSVRYNPLPTLPPHDVGGVVQVNYGLPIGGRPCVADRHDMGIVRSWEAWPFAGINDYTNVLAHTNVENGVGYLGGLAITSVPREECILVGTGAPEFCELYYAPDTSTLYVRPINVSGFPDEYPIENPEDYPFTAGGNLGRGEESWTRRPGSIQSTSDPNAPGIFRYPGLRPGRYRLRVEGFIGSFGLYCEERTLDLGPGETSIDILMTLPEIDPDEPVNHNGCREG